MLHTVENLKLFGGIDRTGLSKVRCHRGPAWRQAGLFRDPNEEGLNWIPAQGRNDILNWFDFW